ncbi:MAG: ATP-binding cassette domain-containing protein, partial [Desulfovibrionaceae bacterium]|nr:ATP-binding cassette domain-containing protein [Desulfovibrionaceae bacterium]
TVFFGPSGSGKTLTLEALAGLMRPDQGEILVDDFILYSSLKKIFVAAKDRQIGYMFQNYALFPHLNVLQNVAYAHWKYFKGLIPKKVKDEAQDLLRRLGLKDLAFRYPQELSGGQCQRVALARALNAKPKLLLLDEPFSALDPLLRRDLRRELAKIMQQVGLPAIIITHDPEDVDYFAEALYLYLNGRAKEIKDFTTIRSKYDSATSCLLDLQDNFKMSFN